MTTNNNGLSRLKAAYATATPNSMALFLGAGVNKCTESVRSVDYQLRTYLWPELLKAIYQRRAGQFAASFDEMRLKFGNDWPAFSDALVAGLDNEQAAQLVDDIIYEDFSRGDKKYKRLPRRFFRQAPSLHAAICFSTEIKRRNEKTWNFMRNQKIGAMVTTNYDFFFGAGWTCYQAFPRHWKVQTPSSGKDAPQEGVLYYVHGYLPYEIGEKKEIILTQRNYNRHYLPGKFAYENLLQTFKRYSMIFIGFSFQDQMVCKVFEQVDRAERRQHFAFVPSAEAAESVRKMGIQPVIFHKYDEIPQLLKDVYCSAIDRSILEEFNLASPALYWERLQKGPT